MKKQFFSRKIKALTLTELLVVMVIIGILVLLALPNLMPQVTKAKTMEAKMQLKHVHRLQKTYFMEYSKYSNDLKALGFEQEQLVDQNGTANYRISIEESSGNGFRAKAEAVADFDGDGTYDVWEITETGQPENTVLD